MSQVQRFESIPLLVQQWGRDTPDTTAVAERIGDSWKETTWSSHAENIRRAGRALIALGVSVGDRVLIVGANRPRWVVADLATMSVGAVSVGVYSACSADQMRRIASHAGAKVAIVDSDVLRAKLVDEPHNENRFQGRVVLDWDAFMHGGEGTPPDEFDARLDAITADANAMFVYTSGTTGEARAVVLTHGSLMACSTMGIQMVPHRPHGMRCLSYLPLAHVAERGLSVLGPARLGYSVFFSEAAEKVPAYLTEVRPHFFLGVPRLYQKVRAKLEPRLENAGGIGGILIRWARRTSTEYLNVRMSGQKPSARLERRYARAKRFVLSRIHKAIGWDRSATFLTGSAPINVDLLSFFATIGVQIQEVYGLSETAGPGSFNRQDATVFGTVGRPFDGIDVRIAPDGEILLKGENLFSGYYDDAEATDEVLRNGWLYTGDLGELDASGFLRVTGRKKNIIVTAGGKNIVPAPIERQLELHPLISSALVIGDGRKFVSALVVPVEDAEDDVESQIAQHIESVNGKLSRPETVKKFALLSRQLDESKGELTPTMKIIRTAVLNNFADEIESLYA